MRSVNVATTEYTYSTILVDIYGRNNNCFQWVD